MRHVSVRLNGREIVKKININLENCYGIRKLAHSFDFGDGPAYSIYAPNGFMKTSLSKTFGDLADGNDSKDLMFPDRATVRQISNDENAAILGENVFVIEPYNQDFNSEKASLLLVNQKIKKQYDDALKEIAEKQETLFKKLKQLSGLTSKIATPEMEMQKVFATTSILELLESLQEKVNSTELDKFSTISYAEIFNEKALAFLSSGTIKEQIQEYIEKYNDLVEKSPILSREFNHYHANAIHKNLSENGFFSANHSINLHNGKSEEKISSSENLAKKLDEEKKAIFSDEELGKKFDAIDKKITNIELRKFRDYLFENKELIPHLAKYELLQKNIWIDYLKNQKEMYNDFLATYQIGKKIISDSVAAAKSEKTEWEEVVNIFNSRFSVPFKMDVSNQEDVILKGVVPQVSFIFFDQEQHVSVEKSSLLKVLSQGERRALYLLNILFEINARKKSGINTLLIVDDIADSFDYKNKYAIIE